MPRVIHIPSHTLIKRQFETSGLLQSTLERISTSYLRKFDYRTSRPAFSFTEVKLDPELDVLNKFCLTVV